VPTKSSMSPLEFNAWLISYQATRQSLCDSVLVLKEELFNVPPEKQTSINLQIGLQNDKINRLDSERTLFYAGSVTMEPPSQKVVEQLQSFATQADQLIAQANATVKAIALADKAVTLYNSAVQPAAA
jgi:hypothetical protein